MALYVEIIGSVAAVLTTASFYPQAWKTIREKDTHSLSLNMYVIFNIGVVLWLVYGILLGSWPLIGANFFTLIPTLTILVMKIRHG